MSNYNPSHVLCWEITIMLSVLVYAVGLNVREIRHSFSFVSVIHIAPGNHMVYDPMIEVTCYTTVPTVQSAEVEALQNSVWEFIAWIEV